MPVSSPRLPYATRFLKWPARLTMRMLGWRIKDPPPKDLPQYVLIGGPHTSNWDAVIMLLVGFSSGIKIGFLMKDSWFRGPLGPIWKALGGVPIDRRTSTDMMAQILDLFAAHPQLIITITPEGTRRYVAYWKAGFYEIAEQAGVPIVLGYLDYRHKLCGFGPALHPSGDIAADMATIRDFYAPVTPRHPEQAGPIRLRPYVIRNRERGVAPDRALSRIRHSQAGSDEDQR
jgi:1-acyl-sn-glycerol-3-phosphate acyltransferase